MAASFSKVGKKFRVTYEHGKDGNGKRIRTFQTAETEAEAKKLVAEFNFNQQRGLLVTQNDVTLAEHLQYWLKVDVENNCQETTIYGYRNIVENHLIPSLGRVKLQELQPVMIQSYYQGLLEKKGLSSNTVRGHHAVLRKALDFALKQQYIYRNVADAVVKPKKGKSIGRSYTPEQAKILLEKVAGTKLEVPVYLALWLGLRREEVTGLQWKHVNLTTRELHIVEVRTAAGNNNNIIKEPKTAKSQRKLYIPDELHQVLTAEKERQEKRKELLGDQVYQNSGYVVVKADGRPYRVNGLSEHFTDFIRKNNLPKIRFHDLRHSYASLMYYAGVDLKAISEIMGHSDIGTTSRIYTHLMDNTFKDKISVMSSILSK